MIKNNIKTTFFLLVFLIIILKLYSLNNTLKKQLRQLASLQFNYNEPLANNSILNIAKSFIPEEKKNNIKQFDLSAPLEPKSVYETIQCKESAQVYVSTTLCVHDLARDVYVSSINMIMTFNRNISTYSVL